ncbi:purple acid phosphatase 27 [Striga asiatica]|uniref:Purple acid phosphatase n=1 Tax=Striga asiatica TaxID=4170 RepID=A0A5A7QFD2_STRAF|nr:purple acid phosphatase 27 [Striga asiatica]
MKNLFSSMRVVFLLFNLLLCFNGVAVLAHTGFGEQPLSRIAIEKAYLALKDSISIKASPSVLGFNVCSFVGFYSMLLNSDVNDFSRVVKKLRRGEDTEWVNVQIENDEPSNDDWVGVFSPAKFNGSICYTENNRKEQAPHICTAPVKYQFANFSNIDYAKTGKASLRLLLINQRADFSFALFGGGLSNPQLRAVSNSISFKNPKAPLYPRLAQGKSWNEMTVTWTSGYNIDEAVPFVEWGFKGSPARTVGWRDPGFIHTSFLKDLWPNTEYTYKIGHILSNGSIAERDGSNEYSNYQPGSLNTTDQIIKDLKNIDIVFHIGDLAYSNGYISQWDQFTAQVEPIASKVPYMVASGNHERDWPGSGSFYDTPDSGGECGVPAETMFFVPAENRAKFWRFRRLRTLFILMVEGNDGVNNKCVNSEKSRYSGTVNGTIHVVVGGGGSHLSEFSPVSASWSLYRDYDWGFVKLTAFNHSYLSFEYKKSRDGKVYDSFTVSRDYRDVLACVHDGCEATTLAS